MNKSGYKHFLYAIVMFFIATIAGLWSWNTLSELLNLPYAQYKHVLAAFILLLAIKWGLSSRHNTIWHGFGGSNERPGH